MTDQDRESLRVWATAHAPVGSLQARQVLELLAELDTKGTDMRKRIYLAGPISKGDLAHNINQGTAAFIALVKAGFSPFCPMWSVYSKPATRPTAVPTGVMCEATVTGNDDMTHADWLALDLPWVAVSDAVLRLPGESTGADLEEACAREHRIPVFTSIPALVAHFRAMVGAGVPG